MQTKVQKWGNSLGVRIPRAVADEARVHAGSAVQIEAKNRAIVIRPLDRPRYRLADLLARVSRRNLHEEVEVGQPVGREAL